MPLHVAIATELPTHWQGAYWATPALTGAPASEESISWAFNKTVPIGGNKTAPNDIMCLLPGTNTQFEHEFIKRERSRAPLTNVIHGCTGKCKAVIRAPALVPTICTTTETTMNYTDSAIWDPSTFNNNATPAEAQAFRISVGLIVEEEQEGIYLITGYFDGHSEACTGIMYQTACTLHAATAEYPVTIVNDVATLDDPGHPHVIAMANNTPTDHTIDHTGFYPSTLSSIALMAWLQWDGYAALVHGGQDTVGYMDAGPAVEAYRIATTGPCNSFSDPKEDVLASLNEMMIWAGVVSAMQPPNITAQLLKGLDPGNSLTSTTIGERTDTHSVFATHFGYFAAAAVVVGMTVLIIAPIYWGFWRLGRPVSFSPLELAKVC